VLGKEFFGRSAEAGAEVGDVGVRKDPGHSSIR
jgi:hypothetical protein